jgi:hypothetical protein
MRMHRGFGLIGLLLAIVIILIMLWMFSSGGDFGIGTGGASNDEVKDLLK